MKKNLLILLILSGLILGVGFAFLPVKISLLLLAGIIAVVVLLMDYQRVTYVVGLYPILYALTLNSPIASIWDELLIIFCIMVWFFKWFVHRKESPYNWTPIEFPMIAMFVIGFFLLYTSEPPLSLALDGLRAVVEYMLFFFIVVQLLRSETGAKRLIYVLVFSGAYMGFVGIYQYFTNVETPAGWMDKVEIKSAPRVFSIIGNPNALGALMVLLIPLALSLVLSEPKWIKKIVFAVSAASMTLCLVFTGSRSSWIGFAAALIIYSILSKNTKILVGLAVSAALVYATVPSVQERIGYMLTDEYIKSSNRDGRIIRWARAIKVFYEYPWFGIGLGRFGGAVASINKVRGTFYIDNYYLKILVEMGIFGFIAFINLLYNSLVWPLRAIGKVKDGISKGIVQSGFSALCGVLVTNVVLNNFDAPSVATYYWVVVAVIVYLGFVNKNADKKVL